MARLSEPPELYGTYNGICVYHMGDGDFMRAASSLTGERVKTETAFANTRAWAARLANASRLASAVYAMLCKSRRRYSTFKKLKSRAMQLLGSGKTDGEIIVELMLSIRAPKRKPRRKRPTQASAPSKTGRRAGITGKRRLKVVAGQCPDRHCPSLFVLPATKKRQNPSLFRRKRKRPVCTTGGP